MKKYFLVAVAAVVLSVEGIAMAEVSVGVGINVNGGVPMPPPMPVPVVVAAPPAPVVVVQKGDRGRHLGHYKHKCRHGKHHHH